MDRYTRRLVKVSEFASFFIRWLFDETQLFAIEGPITLVIVIEIPKRNKEPAGSVDP